MLILYTELSRGNVFQSYTFGRPTSMAPSMIQCRPLLQVDSHPGFEPDCAFMPIVFCDDDKASHLSLLDSLPVEIFLCSASVQHDRSYECH